MKYIKTLTNSGNAKISVSEGKKLKGFQLKKMKKEQARKEIEIEKVHWTRWSMGFNEVLFEYARVEIDALVGFLQQMHEKKDRVNPKSS